MGGAHAQKLLELVACHSQDKDWRPTVVAAIVNPQDEFLLVQRNTRDRNWVFVQGEIEECDGWDPIAAAEREKWEEVGIKGAVHTTVKYLTHAHIHFTPFDREQHDTGYQLGRFYYSVGFRLHAGYSISIDQDALLTHRWLPYQDAVQCLREQPGANYVEHSSIQKREKVLIPAMNAFRNHESDEALLSRL